MHINLNRQSSVSLIRQIHESIYSQIQNGKLEDGFLLPSIRSLAKQIGVSMVTVSKAYSVLEKQGIIMTVRGKGTFVQQGIQQDHSKPTVESVNKNYLWQETFTDYLPGSLYFHSLPDLTEYQFAATDINPQLLDDTALEEKASNQFKSSLYSLSGYSDSQGDKQLREEMAVYLSKSGITVTQKEVMILNGAKEGIELIARMFLGPDDVAVTEAPTVASAAESFRSRGATVFSIPVDEYGIKVDELERLCEKNIPKLIYTNPGFQNPSTTVLSQDRREKLIHIAQEYGIIIIEDDSLNEIYFNDVPPPPIKKQDDYGNVIYLKEFSKLFSTGNRTAALVANGSIFDRLLVSKVMSGIPTPLLQQKVLFSLLNSETFDIHIEKLRTGLSNRCKKMLDTLTEHAPEGITWRIPAGGLHVWMTCPFWFNTEQFCFTALTKGVSVSPGISFYPADPEHNHIRVCFSFLEEKQIEDGTKHLCSLLAESMQLQRKNQFSP